MKMYEALALIEQRPTGFVVMFERLDRSLLCSDSFPDIKAGEDPIATEEEAWSLAAAMAEKTQGRFVNFYVADLRYRPVAGAPSKVIRNR